MSQVQVDKSLPNLPLESYLYISRLLIPHLTLPIEPRRTWGVRSTRTLPLGSGRWASAGRGVFWRSGPPGLLHRPFPGRTRPRPLRRAGRRAPLLQGRTRRFAGRPGFQAEPAASAGGGASPPAVLEAENWDGAGRGLSGVRSRARRSRPTPAALSLPHHVGGLTGLTNSPHLNQVKRGKFLNTTTSGGIGNKAARVG